MKGRRGVAGGAWTMSEEFGYVGGVVLVDGHIAVGHGPHGIVKSAAIDEHEDGQKHGTTTTVTHARQVSAPATSSRTDVWDADMIGAGGVSTAVAESRATLCVIAIRGAAVLCCAYSSPDSRCSAVDCARVCIAPSRPRQRRQCCSGSGPVLRHLTVSRPTRVPVSQPHERRATSHRTWTWRDWHIADDDLLRCCGRHVRAVDFSETTSQQSQD